MAMNAWGATCSERSRLAPVCSWIRLRATRSSLGSSRSDDSWTKERRSSRVPRPAVPVPVIVTGSSWCSVTNRRTTGDLNPGRVRRGRRRRAGWTVATVHTVVTRVPPGGVLPVVSSDQENMVKLFDRLAHHPNGRNGHGDVPLDEALADHRLACISRAIDDREIALRQQSQGFFQISGAGHEALLLRLTRALRAGYDWVFPFYRDRALVLGLGVTPLEILLQAVGSADDPASGGRPLPCPWGDAACT